MRSTLFPDRRTGDRLRQPAPSASRPGPVLAAGMTLALLAGSPAAQAPSYPGCDTLKSADFRKVAVRSIASAGRVTKFAFTPDGRMLLAAQNGAIGLLNPTFDTALVPAGSLPNVGNGIWGLMGIVAALDFATTGHFYVYATRPVATDSSVSSIRRYTLKGNQVDRASEKVLLEWPVQRQGVDHSGGGMGIDAAGNVIVGTGDNTMWTQEWASVNEVDEKFNALRSAGNTDDLRGKIIRIKPLSLADSDPAPAPGLGRTYDIPAGNLFPPGTEKARPEIYAMGNRNPFTLTVDPVTGWVFWADVGTQAPAYSATKGAAGMDEFNAAPDAGNYGWPMFNGPNLAFNKYDYAADAPGPFFDSLNPVNDSRLNSGIQNLPLPKPPLVAYGKDGKNNPWTGFQRSGAVPIAGPVYRYRGDNPSRTKFPPHLDGKWIVADHIAGWFKVITFDAAGRKALAVHPLFPELKYGVSQLLDVKIGPDGALWVLEWESQALSRIEYTGSCHPAVSIAPAPRPGVRPPRPALLAGGRRRLTVPAGLRGFSLYDVQGRRIWTYARKDFEAPAIADLPAGLCSQILRIRWDEGSTP